MPTIAARLTEALTGRYRVDRELGAGGMATVLLAQEHERNAHGQGIIHPSSGLARREVGQQT